LLAKEVNPDSRGSPLSALINERRLVIWSPTETGKSEFIAVAYPIWLLGHNKNFRIIIVSNTVEQVEKFILKIGEEILRNPFIQVVFPDLKPLPSSYVPSRAQKWTSRHLMVQRDFISKDYSVSGYGVGGAILNARADVIILDDVIDLEIARSPTQRNYINEWTESTVMPRLVKDGQLVCIGTPWHPSDLMHHLARKRTFKFVKYSLIEEDAADGYRIIDWPEIYPKERIEYEMAELSSREFARTKRCRITLAESKSFPSFDSCLQKVDAWNPPTSDLTVSIGVDVASSSRPGTAICVVGMDNSSKVRYLLDIRFGQWTGPQINKIIKEIYLHWKAKGLAPAYVVVENNAVQSMVGEWLTDPEAGIPDLPLLPFTTGKNKADPNIGLPSLELEFERGLWVIPEFIGHQAQCSCHWCRLVREFRNHPDHPSSDGVMALWFAREPLRNPLGAKRKRLRKVTDLSQIFRWVEV